MVNNNPLVMALGLLSSIIIAGCTVNANKTNLSDDIDAKVQQLLGQMSLEEKVGQMTQVDFSYFAVPEAQNNGFPMDLAKLEDAVVSHHVGSLLNTAYNKAQPIATWRQMMQAVQDAAARTRLKIPVLYGIDAIHGATYTQGATLFPQALNMAATFNPELAFQEGEISAREVRASGQQWSFYPVMDIGRQPLWPRFWETYGEDVHLSSVMGAAYIQGHQGDDFSAADKAPTCLKHYLGYSFPFSGRDRTPAYIGERTLRELFLPGFAAGVAAGAPTVMINSGEVDGIPTHANHHYLTTILREELGFKGFTVSDWEDINRLYTRDKVAASLKEAVKMAVLAGVDMSMVPFDFSFAELLAELVRAGEVPMARIDEAVARILRVKFQAGLFESRPMLPVEGNFATPDATEINRQAARESIVLAKNDAGTLPFKKDAKILVTGPTANLLNVMNGGWSVTWQGDDENLYPKDKPTLLAALQQKSLGEITWVGGAAFDSPIDIATAVAASRTADYILLCLGEKPYAETPGNIGSLELEARQTELANALLATGKPVVLLMLQGRPRIISDLAAKAQAVVLGFLPGMEGGTALADILYGDYNPDGKLPITYPRNGNDIVLYDHKPSEAFDMNAYQPLYPFGHGLSYTRFATYGLEVAKATLAPGENATVSVTVKNTGDLPGKETVLLYLNDTIASVTRPLKQLKAFQKVALQPGEAKRLSFSLTPEDLSFIGIDLQRRIEPGEFRVMVGNESVTFELTNQTSMD